MGIFRGPTGAPSEFTLSWQTKLHYYIRLSLPGPFLHVTHKFLSEAPTSKNISVCTAISCFTSDVIPKFLLFLSFVLSVKRCIGPQICFTELTPGFFRYILAVQVCSADLSNEDTPRTNFLLGCQSSAFLPVCVRAPTGS